MFGVLLLMMLITAVVFLFKKYVQLTPTVTTTYTLFIKLLRILYHFFSCSVTNNSSFSHSNAAATTYKYVVFFSVPGFVQYIYIHIYIFVCYLLYCRCYCYYLFMLWLFSVFFFWFVYQHTMWYASEPALSLSKKRELNLWVKRTVAHTFLVLNHLFVVAPSLNRIISLLFVQPHIFHSISVYSFVWPLSIHTAYPLHKFVFFLLLFFVCYVLSFSFSNNNWDWFTSTFYDGTMCFFFFLFFYTFE